MASTADGSVAITVDLNVDEAEKEVARLRKKIIGLESDLNENKSKRNVLVEKLKEAEAELEKVQKQTQIQDGKAIITPENIAKITELKNGIAEIQAQIDKTDEAIAKGTVALDSTKRTQAEYTAEADRLAEIKRQEVALEQAAEEAGRAHLQTIAQSAEVADQNIINLRNELADLSARQSELKQAGLGLGYQEYDQIEARLAEINGELRDYKSNLQQSKDAATDVAGGVEEIANASSRAGGFLGKLGSRIVGLAKRVFIFSLITSALRSMRTWLSKVIKTNDEANAAFARLRGALLTLAQPLVEIIIPALTTLANILTVIVTSIASMLSGLFGKTAKQSADAAKGLYEETQALEGVGGAAEEAAGSLAGFDEINTIQTENNKGGGGGANAAATIPDFTLDAGITDRLKEIADLVGLIAAGLALWKLSSMLPGVLGTIASLLAGILLTVGGLLLFWNGLTDAWENGVDWMNLIEMIGGLAAAALGLYLLFGPIAAGIALVVGGLAMLVTAFHDAMENGWNLQNSLLAIAGILAAGLGISLITGSWIPLLIAGIAAVLLALTNATGHGEELIAGIQEVIQGFKDFFVGIFTGDMELAIQGISEIFDGLGMSIGAVIDGLRDTILGFLDWLDEKTGGKFTGIINAIKELVTTTFGDIKEVIGNVVGALKQIFTGLVEFVGGVFSGDWDTAWNGVKDIFKGVWNGIVSLLECAVNIIIDGINWMISQINKISFTAPSWVPMVGGKTIGFNIPQITKLAIPRLAEGAVIPPNREFMAVLGDQRSGTNIEAPTSEIEKAVENVLNRRGTGNGRPIQVNLVVDGKTLARVVVPQINDMTRQAGKPVLLV